MSVLNSIIGHKFNRLTVIGVDLSLIQGRLICKCECGEEKIVYKHHLMTGKTKSCGCYNIDSLLKRNLKHGYSNKSGEYKSWSHMIQRCTNEKNISYKNYGGRGIKVCDRWLHSFKNFLEDIGKRPTPKHSLDRYPNNDGNYEPTNCRWGTKHEQSINRRNSHLLTFENKTFTVSEWANKLNIDSKLIYSRIKKGWSTEDALFAPIQLIRRKGIVYR